MSSYADLVAIAAAAAKAAAAAEAANAANDDAAYDFARLWTTGMLHAGISQEVRHPIWAKAYDSVRKPELTIVADTLAAASKAAAAAAAAAAVDTKK